MDEDPFARMKADARQRVAQALAGIKEAKGKLLAQLLPPTKKKLAKVSRALQTWQGSFWFGAAGAAAAAVVVSINLTIASQFSDSKHPGHYAPGSLALVVLCEFVVIFLALFPIQILRRCTLTDAWLTNVSSSILVAFVSLSVAAALGVFKRLPFVWGPFVWQLLGAVFALSAASSIFTEWEWAAGQPDLDMTGRVPLIVWIAYAAYLVGGALIAFGILELRRLPEGIVVALGSLLLLAGLWVSFEKELQDLRTAQAGDGSGTPGNHSTHSK